MIKYIISLDHSLFQFINGSLSNPFFDSVMPFITDPNTWGLPLLLFWLGLILFGKKRGRIAAVILLIAVVLTDVIAAQLIKPLVGRIRPSHALLDSINLLVAPGGKYSFVSNHAANSFAIAVVVGYFYRRTKPWLYALATVIAFSRVYVGVHYPADVIFGGLFGYSMAWIVISAWVILKMRELKRGRTWVWYENTGPGG
ncbi:MAG: phosphatase PAP2 family protein [FCB group bacterium]|nr:phosphatase PAP2 family protein [FCB group bacterium]